jgi:hypothetical protein
MRIYVGLFPWEIGVFFLMTFEILLFRLKELLREKVRTGQLTERGMARATGVSQPHLHNILKGIRALPTELADQLLGVSGSELSFLTQGGDPEPKNSQTHDRWDHSIEIERIAAQIISPPGALLSCRLPQDLAMEPCFKGGDIVYYGPAASERNGICATSPYLVSYGGHLLARYLRLGGKRLYLVSEASLKDPIGWDYVSLADRHILEIVRGRIVWICRKVEEAETAEAETARGLNRRVG